MLCSLADLGRYRHCPGGSQPAPSGRGARGEHRAGDHRLHAGCARCDIRDSFGRGHHQPHPCADPDQVSGDPGYTR